MYRLHGKEHAMSDHLETARPTPHPGVLRIAPYVHGSGGQPDGQRPVHKLSSNEAPNGPSPLALAAYREAAVSLAFYPDGSATLLRMAIGEVQGLDPARIVCGSGSDELLGLLARLYLGPGDEALMSQHGFLMYRIHTLACGGTPVLVADRDLGTDVDALLAAVTERTRLVFLANPNNPTGTCLGEDQVARLAAGLPKTVLLVLDAAYAEYVTRCDYDAGVRLVDAHENVVMVRTFSKIYGLAAMRIGWLYGPEHIVDVLNRIRGPFNLSGPAIAAGIAAMRDQDFVAEQQRFNAEWRGRMEDAIRGMGLVVTHTEGNFLLIHFPAERPESLADAANAFLTERGFILRPVKPYGLPHALRLSVGTAEANAGVLAVLEDFTRSF